MVAYSFNRRFEEPILAGTKCGTIRAVGRRRHARPGETVQLYRGMRTRHCRLLGTSTCFEVEPIRLLIVDAATSPRILGITIGAQKRGQRAPVFLDVPEAVDIFARGDGFSDGASMARFWCEAHRDLISAGSLLFDGLWIRWAPRLVSIS